MRIPFFRPKLSPDMARKASAAYALQFQNLDQAHWSKRDYEAFAREGYTYNVVAYQAIRRIATALSTIEWIVELPDGDKKTSHPVLDVINNPNPAQTRIEFLEAKISYLYLHGNTFDERVARGTRLIELWTHRPDRFSIKLGRTGLPAQYTYTLNGRETHWKANLLSGDSAIYQSKLFNPLDDLLRHEPIQRGRLLHRRSQRDNDLD